VYAINEHQGQFAKDVIGNYYDLTSVSGPRAAAVVTGLSNTSHWSPTSNWKGNCQGGTPAALVYFQMSSVPRDIGRRWHIMNCEGCVRKRQWFRTDKIPTFFDVTQKPCRNLLIEGKTSWDSNLPPAEYKSIVLPLNQTMRRFHWHFSPSPMTVSASKLVNS